MSRRQAEQLRVELSDDEAQQILSEAIAQVPGFYTPGDIAVPERRILIGAASLAIGDTTYTRRLLHFLKDEDHLLLAARYFMWTGDAATLKAQFPKIAAASANIHAFAEMDEVAVALESLGAGQPGARAPVVNTTRRLLPDYEAGDCNVLPAANAADTVLTFVHGMLGAAPDAGRGRLRLRTRMPEWLVTMSVYNLRLGDALITLNYTVTAGGVSYNIEQTAGAMPVRLIFEPTFTKPVRSIVIDDIPADLDLQPLRDRIVAPVQLMLDHARSLIFTE